jgi:hypothetical protein
MTERNLFHMSIDELERMFDGCRDKRDMLESLLQELKRRNVPRAKRLKERTVAAIAVLDAERFAAVEEQRARKRSPETSSE